MFAYAADGTRGRIRRKDEPRLPAAPSITMNATAAARNGVRGRAGARAGPERHGAAAQASRPAGCARGRAARLRGTELRGDRAAGGLHPRGAHRSREGDRRRGRGCRRGLAHSRDSRRRRSRSSSPGSSRSGSRSRWDCVCARADYINGLHDVVARNACRRWEVTSSDLAPRATAARPPRAGRRPSGPGRTRVALRQLPMRASPSTATVPRAPARGCSPC